MLSLLSSSKLHVIQRRKAARLLCKPVGILGDKNLSLVPKPLFRLYLGFISLRIGRSSPSVSSQNYSLGQAGCILRFKART